MIQKGAGLRGGMVAWPESHESRAHYFHTSESERCATCKKSREDALRDGEPISRWNYAAHRFATFLKEGK